MTPKTVQPITDELLADIEEYLSLSARHLDDEQAAVTKYELRALIARLRAAEKDAERWRYARQLMHPLDIVDFQDARDSIGLPATENISLQVDAAIDAAMHQG